MKKAILKENKKYIRIGNNIRRIVYDYVNSVVVKSDNPRTIDGFTIIHGVAKNKRSDNIQDLCDRFIVYYKDINVYSIYDYYDEAISLEAFDTTLDLYGVVETKKGLKYVAKYSYEIKELVVI